MIEVNLSPKVSEGSLTKLGGINLSLINVKLLVIGIVLVYAIEPLVGSIYDDQIVTKENQTVSLNKQIRKLRGEISSKNAIKERVEKLKDTERQLRSKITIVKQIVDKRQNPYLVLKYIAENTPEEVWVEDLEIEDRKVTIIGYSKSWKKIGEFIENLKSSIFFDGNVNFSKPEGLKNTFNSNRVETYKIITNIVAFK